MVNVRSSSLENQERYVRLVGEFGKPGIYKITSSTRLSEIYERAGLNPQAFPLELY